MIGVDVGGTFTDVVVVSGTGVEALKVPTTPDQSDGVIGAVAGLDASVFLHGTTAATNTLLEGRGARVALLTDPGYEDLIEIARQERPSLYDSSVDRPVPLVPRERRYSDPAQVTDAEIVAISLLDSYLDNTAERSLADGLALPAVLSSVVSPEFREYERLATTALAAYLTPSVSEYLRSLDQRLQAPSRLVMTSAGGLIPFTEATSLAGRLVLSGPAGGVVAAAAVGRHHGHESVIAFDMGGTSTDVCRITGGEPSIGTGHHVAGRVNRVPSVPIRTIGAGGGSVAWLDEGGALRVGPRSSGANPGPAVYGLGGLELTVTDANVLAGNIPHDLSLGGSVSLDVAAGEAAAERLSAESGIDRSRVVAGVLEVVDAHMERALRSVSVEEGSDPRESALVAFGGAGGLHASRLAQRLGMATVLVPPHSGVLSAVGLLLATPRADAVRTVMIGVENTRLQTEAIAIEEAAAERFRSMFGQMPESTSITADLRYVGQSHELEVPLVGAQSSWGDLFHTTHRDRFGFERRGETVEVVNIRATASGRAPLGWSDVAPPVPEETTARGEGGVWHRSTLPPGFTTDGPATVVEANSAIRVEPGDTMIVLGDGTLEITR